MKGMTHLRHALDELHLAITSGQCTADEHAKLQAAHKHVWDVWRSAVQREQDQQRYKTFHSVEPAP